MTEVQLFEQLNRYYEVLGIDENADEEVIKQAYKDVMRTNINDYMKESQQKKKLASEALLMLNNPNNRQIYKKLRSRYFAKKYLINSFEKKEKPGNTEQKNKYIFNRRDGSKIEIKPIGRYNIENNTIYSYKIYQYYKDITYINTIYGRINLPELLNSEEYCDFCVNSFFSKQNIIKACKRYNGYMGYIGGRRLNKMMIYKHYDAEHDDLDICVRLSDFLDNETLEIQLGDISLFLEKIGSVITHGKNLVQYSAFSDEAEIAEILYGDDIDFNRIKNLDFFYENEVATKLISEKRIREKVEECGGYIGGLIYNPEKDNYDVIVDDVLKRVMVKNKEKEK